VTFRVLLGIYFPELLDVVKPTQVASAAILLPIIKALMLSCFGYGAPETADLQKCKLVLTLPEYFDPF